MYFAEAIFQKYKGQKYDIKGSVFFSQLDEYTGVRVDINLVGVPDGVHGIHVHEKPVNFAKKNPCNGTCGHFNGSVPKWSLRNTGGTPHGSWLRNTNRHIGDLCNNVTSENGIVDFSYVDTLISLIPGHPNNIVGRSIILHQNEDDQGLLQNKLEYAFQHNLPFVIDSYDYEDIVGSKITGNAGLRIACANIEYLRK